MGDAKPTAELRWRIARPDDAAALREVMIRSKAHWGFDDEFMGRFAAVIGMSPVSVGEADVWILEKTGSIVGFYALVPQGDGCVLDDLWLLPDHIGGGLGRLMFEHAARRARGLGAAVMTWDAEPYAMGFYSHMGGRVVGEKVSKLGRTTPVMAFDLSGLDRTRGPHPRVAEEP